MSRVSPSISGPEGAAAAGSSSNTPIRSGTGAAAAAGADAADAVAPRLFANADCCASIPNRPRTVTAFCRKVANGEAAAFCNTSGSVWMSKTQDQSMCHRPAADDFHCREYAPDQISAQRDEASLSPHSEYAQESWHAVPMDVRSFV